MEILDDNFMVCEDCIQVIANDDYTGLDYHYNEQDSQRRMDEINAGLEKVGAGLCCGDSDKNDDFSLYSCDCCGSDLHGERFHCVILGEANHV